VCYYNSLFRQVEQVQAAEEPQDRAVEPAGPQSGAEQLQQQRSAEQQQLEAEQQQLAAEQQHQQQA